MQYEPIYLQPFTSYSEILVGNCNFSLLPLHLTPMQLGVISLDDLRDFFVAELPDGQATILLQKYPRKVKPLE